MPALLLVLLCRRPTPGPFSVPPPASVSVSVVVARAVAAALARTPLALLAPLAGRTRP